MDHLEVIRMYIDLFNNRTLAEQAHAVLDPDAVLRTGTGVEVKGRDNYVATSLGFVTWMPDVHAELVDHKVSGDTASITMALGGTFTGEMPTPDGTVIPGNGNRAEWQSNAAIEFKDGKIARWETSLDMQDFMSQLGLG
jgi:predicted ester cyclase